MIASILSFFKELISLIKPVVEEDTFILALYGGTVLDRVPKWREVYVVIFVQDHGVLLEDNILFLPMDFYRHIDVSSLEVLH